MNLVSCAFNAISLSGMQVLFETEANRDSQSTFEMVSFLGWASRSGTRKYFAALVGLVGRVQDIFSLLVETDPPPPSCYAGSIMGQYGCIFKGIVSGDGYFCKVLNISISTFCVCTR